jgi:hypothetical protein
MKELSTGHKIYPVTNYVNLWPPTVTLNLEVGDWCVFALDTLSYYCEIRPSILKILSLIRKLWTGHDINPQIDNVDLYSPSATSTLEVGVRLLRLTHRLIITNICANLFRIPL